MVIKKTHSGIFILKRYNNSFLRIYVVPIKYSQQTTLEASTEHQGLRQAVQEFKQATTRKGHDAERLQHYRDYRNPRCPPF